MATDQKLFIRRGYRCGICKREWSRFALLGDATATSECVFCGLYGSAAGPIMVLMPGGQEVILEELGSQ